MSEESALTLYDLREMMSQTSDEVAKRTKVEAYSKLVRGQKYPDVVFVLKEFDRR